MCDQKSFDELSDLYKSSPEAFEDYRTKFIKRAITDLCADCPECLKRCERFQWRLEQDLNKFKNPIARYNRLVELFWKQTEEFKHITSTFELPEKPTHTATVVDFKPKS